MIIEETCRAYAVGEATFGATVDLWDEVPEDVNEGIIHRGTIAIDRISEAAPTFDDVIAPSTGARIASGNISRSWQPTSSQHSTPCGVSRKQIPAEGILSTR